MLNYLHNIPINLLLIVHSVLGFNEIPLVQEINNKTINNINNVITKGNTRYSMPAEENKSYQLPMAIRMQLLDYLQNCNSWQSLKKYAMRIFQDDQLKFTAKKGYKSRSHSLHHTKKSMKDELKQMSGHGNKKKTKNHKINLLQMAASIMLTPGILMGIFLPFILPALKMATFTSMVMNNVAFMGALMYAIRSHTSYQPELHINYSTG